MPLQWYFRRSTAFLWHGGRLLLFCIFQALILFFQEQEGILNR